MGMAFLVVYLFRVVLKDVPEKFLEHEDPLEPLPEESVDVIVDKVAQFFADKKLAFPTNLLLEISIPVSYWTSQVFIIGHPVLKTFVSPKNINALCAFLSDRKNMKKLVERLEQKRAEVRHERKTSELELESKGLRD